MNDTLQLQVNVELTAEETIKLLSSLTSFKRRLEEDTTMLHWNKQDINAIEAIIKKIEKAQDKAIIQINLNEFQEFYGIKQR